MQNKLLTDIARQYYDNGDFLSALHTYKDAEKILGYGLFEYNIKKCREQLGLSLNGRPSAINSYFDKVYVVNLKHESANRLKIANQLNNACIEYELFTATNGYKGDAYQKWLSYASTPIGSMQFFSKFNELEKKRGKKFIESAGAIGYIKTYLRILENAKSANHKRILILEDDVILSHDFEIGIKRFMDNIKDDWKLIHLGASQYGWEDISTFKAKKDYYYHPRQLKTTGSFAIGIDMSIADEIIDLQEKFEVPFDHISMGEIYEKYNDKCFVAYPNLIMPDVADSSIRGSRCQYSHSKRVKWDVERYPYPYPKPSVALVVTDPANLKYFESFSSPVDSPFTLRLYRPSADGLRPVHNNEHISKTYTINNDDLENSIIPKSDLYGRVLPGVVLTEGLILNFMEEQFGLKRATSESIKPFIPIVPKVEPGLVSVIVPTYKRPINLDTAVKSILEQSYENFEIFIVNDNGLDSEYNAETDKIVSMLQENDQHNCIHYVKHSKNRNGAAARNTGIMLSRGQYIAFLDDDDMYLPNRLLDGLKALRGTNNRYGGVYCGFLGWNSPVNNPDRYKEGDLTQELLSLDYFKHYLHTNTATYKREAVFTINGFDETYRRHQDLEFNIRFFQLFEIMATKSLGVRLNPMPSTISNKVHDLTMLNLKKKFLSQFRDIIESSGRSEEIYSKHWKEVIKYLTNDRNILEALLSQKENGELQVYSLLSTKTI